MMRAFLIGVTAVLLAACGEVDQATTEDRYMPDAEPWKGASNAVYTAKGWTPGNKTEWENQVRTRGQLQNEYNRVN